MKTIVTFFFLQIFSIISLAQSFGMAPLNYGNKWIYYIDNGFYHTYSLSDKTTIIDSLEYYILNENSYPIYVRMREDGYYVQRRDSTYFEPNHEQIYYKKNANLDDMWTNHLDSTNIYTSVVTDTFTIHIFDSIVIAKNIYIDIGLVDHDQLWTNEFGLVALRESEAGDSEYLMGCVINGIVYGDTTTTSVEYEPIINLPENIELFQNYPNPFNPNTIIEYNLPEEGNVTLTVYNLLGEMISVLVNEYQRSGKYKVKFNSEEIQNIPSGIYFYTLKTGSAIKTKKMVLVH